MPGPWGPRPHEPGISKDSCSSGGCLEERASLLDATLDSWRVAPYPEPFSPLLSPIAAPDAEAWEIGLLSR